jgi:MFS family permease
MSTAQAQDARADERTTTGVEHPAVTAVSAPAETIAPPEQGRPMRPLPLAHLLNISLYWLGINVIWAGLGYLIIQARFTATYGQGVASGYQALLETLPVFIAILVQPTVATISDYTITRWGRRKPYIVIGSVLDVVFLYGVATSNDFLAILAFFTLLQCSSNFAQGPFQGYVPDLVPEQQVGTASGLMGVMIVLGQGVGVAIAALGVIQMGSIEQYYGTPMGAQLAQQAFFLPTMGLALIEVVTMIPLVLFVDDGRHAPDRAGRSWTQIALSAWGTDILRERSYVWLLVSRLFFLAAPSALTFLGFYYLTQTFGYAESESGGLVIVLTAALGITTGLTTIPAAKLSDRIGRKRTIYIAIAFGIFGMLAVALAPNFPVMVIAILPVGIAAGTFLAVDWALMTDIIPKGTTGRYMGISNVATAVSGPVGRLTAGLISAGLVLIGLPADLRNVPNSGPQSVYYEIAPRVALIAALVFFAISGWALRHVDERRRED